MSYPSTLDSLPEDQTNVEVQRDNHPQLHNRISASINALQKTLGLHPQGAASDVAERLAELEEAIGDGVGGGGAGDSPEFHVDFHGAAGDDVADDSDAIASTVASAVAAGGGVVVFGTGTYRITDLEALNIGTEPVNVRGQGIEATTLKLDVGTSTSGWGIKHAEPTDFYAFRTIEDLTVEGPGATSRGAAPHNQVIGIRWATRTVLRNVRVRYCKYGIEVWGNHQDAHDCQALDNFYGVYYPPQGSLGSGDQTFDHCSLEGNALACIGVGAANSGPQPTVHDVDFHHTHMGFGMYSFFLEGSDHTTPALNNVTFEQSHFESQGNAGIYGPNRRIEGISFHDCYWGKSASYKSSTYYSSAGAGPTTAESKAWIDAWLIDGLRIDSYRPFVDAFDDAVIEGRAVLAGIEIRSASDFVHRYLSSLGKPVFKGPSVSEARVLWGSGEARACQGSGAAIAKGDVVHEGPFGSASSTDGDPATIDVCTLTGDKPLGIAMEAFSYPACGLICTRGDRNGKASGAIATGDPVVADADTGKVKSAQPGLALISRTNAVRNPSFEHDSTGAAPADWAVDHGGAGGTTTAFEVVASHAAEGSKALHVAGTAGSAGFALQDTGDHGSTGSFPLSPGQSWAIQAVLDIVTNPGNFYLVIHWRKADGTDIGYTQTGAIAGTGAKTPSFVGVAPALAAYGFVQLYNDATSGAIDYYVDAVMAEQANVVRGYFDGDSPLASWSGTAGDSASERDDYVLSTYGQILGMALDDVADGGDVPVRVLR